MTSEHIFNGYVFEPQPDGTLQIRLSEEAGGSEVTNLPADLVTALRAYLGGTAEGQRAVGTPDVTVESAREQPINPRDRIQENW
jgi:hypothetical protein